MPSTSHRIAVILPAELELSGRLLEGAVEYAKAHRRVSLVELPYQGNDPNALRFDAVPPFDAALVGATKRAQWMETLISRRVPLVSASGDWAEENVPSIYFDGPSIVRTAVEHLARRAPATLAHLEFVFEGSPLAEGRNRRFRDLAERRGIPATRYQIFTTGDWADSAVARRSPLQGEVAEHLIVLIAERACEGLAANEVAVAVGLSPQTLHARFIERIGRTPGEEIRRVRVATAKRLLADPRLSIGEVAERCGYGQQGKFSNFFRRETGCSPREFRQRHD
jgi:AraC-like DNA-binding protein